MKYTSENIVLAGYRIIGLITREIIVSGMRIAVVGELKSIKMLIDPNSGDDLSSDLELLEILEEQDVKLAYQGAVHVNHEVMPQYRMLFQVDDKEILANDEVEELASALYWRFMFIRVHHRRKDRYVNFRKVLFYSQRLLYEWCKVMILGERRMFSIGYRSNYSPGRLLALIAGHSNYYLDIVVELIYYLQEMETRTGSFVENKKFIKK